MKPEQLEYAAPGPGQCIVHRMGGEPFIERADPVVAIASELIVQVQAGTVPRFSMDGATLVIDASNQRVCYRLGPCSQPGYMLGRLV